MSLFEILLMFVVSFLAIVVSRREFERPALPIFLFPSIAVWLLSLFFFFRWLIF